MYAEQDGKCALCGDPMTFADACVDHDHNTGAVRELLHSNCNVLIGFAEDNTNLLIKGVEYIARHQHFSC